MSGTLLGGTTVSGSLDLITGSGSGSASYSGEIGDEGASGTIAVDWSVSRIETIECPEPGTPVLAGTALLVLALSRRSLALRSGAGGREI